LAAPIGARTWQVDKSEQSAVTRKMRQLRGEVHRCVSTPPLAPLARHIAAPRRAKRRTPPPPRISIHPSTALLPPPPRTRTHAHAHAEAATRIPPEPPRALWQVPPPAKGAGKRDAKTGSTPAIPLRQGEVEEDFETMSGDVAKYAPNLDIDLELEVRSVARSP
jgi:hypothetical protein